MAKAPEYGDAPIEDRFYQDMNMVAGLLDAVFNGEVRAPHKEVGWVLLVFPYGETEGRCNYISNGANRRDVSTLLKEQAARFDAQLDEEKP